AGEQSVKETDFQILFRPIRDDDTREWLTLDEFRDELPRAVSRDVSGSDGETGKTKDFRATAKIMYNGSRDLTNLYMDVLRTDPDGTENRVASRIIPALFRETEREVSFIISPEKMEKGFFTVDIAGDGVSLHWPKASSGGGSSGGGCNMGPGGLALLALSALFLMKKVYPRL
ncbi:MAG: hypothetical protein K5841_04590, partial [Fretibacterium sp.]|nr:hypothetical protein [Fretibacterium sp.]